MAALGEEKKFWGKNERVSEKPQNQLLKIIQIKANMTWLPGQLGLYSDLMRFK